MRTLTGIFLFFVAVILAGCAILFIPDPWGFCLGLGIVVLTVYVFVFPQKKNKYIKIGPYKWTHNDFCRNWLITGQTGSGKTACAIKTILHALCRDCPDWGGAIVDQKGQFFEIISGIAAHYKQSERLVILRVGDDSICYNLLSYPGISWRSYAGIIIDTAECIGVKLEPFWKSSSEDLLSSLLELIAVSKKPALPTMADVYDAINNMPTLKRMAETPGLPPSEALNKLNDFLKLVPATRDGIISSCKTYLNFFSSPEIRKVFCPDKNTVDLRDIDNGKIFVLSMPQTFTRERIFFNTFFKLLFTYHARFRFDSDYKEKNLIAFIADEAQQVITASVHSSDHETVGIIREAKATFILATQSITSFKAKLKTPDVDALCLNLSNQVHFTVADDEAAKFVSQSLGVHKVWDKSHSIDGRGNESTTRKQIETFIYTPGELRGLHKYECVLKHCSGKTTRIYLPPRTDSDTIPGFYFRDRFGFLGYFFSIFCR